MIGASRWAFVPLGLLLSCCGTGLFNRVPTVYENCIIEDAEVCAEAVNVSTRALESVYEAVSLVEDARATGNRERIAMAAVIARDTILLARDAFKIAGRDPAPLIQAQRVVEAAIAYISI